jgi:hypothetical protein
MGAIGPLNVGRPLVADRPHQNELGTSSIKLDRSLRVDGGTSRHRCVQPVRRRHHFGPGVLEKLELMVKMINGAGTLAFGNSPPRTRRQHHNPQYAYED